MNINDAITKLEAIAKLPEKWRNQANHGPLPNGLVSETTLLLAEELAHVIGPLPVDPVPEVPADPYAELKVAWESGRRIRCRNGEWSDKVSHPDGPLWSNPVSDYQIEPLPADKWAAEKAAPAGKLSDEQLGVIGAEAASMAMGAIRFSAYLSIRKTAAHCSEDLPARTSFACAVREAVEKGTPWGAVGQTQEEWLHSTSELGRMAHERFFGEIARLTAEVKAKHKLLADANRGAERNAQINWSQAGKINSMTAELAKANAELERYTKEYGALIVEHSKLQAELERLRWRPVSVKPTREDADTADRITVLCKNGKMQRVPLDAMGFRPDFDWSKSDDGEQFMFWRPTCPPPAPTAEEKERAEFEKWFKETTEKEGFSKNFGQIAFEAWKAALASIEVKHS